MPTCDGCGAHVSASFVRVFEPAPGEGVDRCLECTDRADLVSLKP